MKFDVENLLASAMIGQAVNIKLRNKEEFNNKVIKSIDPPWLRTMEGHTFMLEEIEYIERSGFRYTDMQANVEQLRKKLDAYRASKDNRLTLAKRFCADVEALRECVGRIEGVPDLNAFFADSAALGGDIRRCPMDTIEAQLEEACKTLPPRQAAFARAMVHLAKRNMDGAIKPYLDLMNQEEWTEFVRGNAAKLAVITMQGQRQNDPNPVGFIFWIDQLLEIDPQQVYSDQGLWLNYLHGCVRFQHFANLCAALPKMEAQGEQLRGEAFDALVYVFALNEHISAACDAMAVRNMTGQDRTTVKGVAIRLIDDPMSYCVRYANRVKQLIEDGDIGCPDRGYIYDYVRSKRDCHVVSGMLFSHHVHETVVNAELIRYMKESLASTGDYPADLVELKTDEYGSVTELNRW